MNDELNPEHEGMTGNGDGERRHNVSHPDSRTMVAMAERLVRVETKMEGVERDTAMIRRALHEHANTVQAFIASVSNDKQHRDGETAAYLKMGTALMGAVALGAALVTMAPVVVGWLR